jgi:hypothetical protein
MRAAASLVLFSSLLVAACGPTVDLAKALQVQDVSTGWFDAGIVDGKNKLVPSITCKFKNTSDQKLTVLQVNAVFHLVNDPSSERGATFLTAAGSEGLAAGATTPPLTLRSNLGYTGSDQTRDELLHNSKFVDENVTLLAKYGSTQWTKVGEFPIERRLITK